ncbi:hypothetical protein D9758_012321 [Tetrapyrgos nigripes]|uniref:Uncharacterized protein n=1 Tax=Tetrapyrgos nigripes TaxID=182062 RepID=A0A8H5FPR2_9AGAR|nr:hypothetical protein D9758_012321 [Tetrapyrgos nigripes]
MMSTMQKYFCYEFLIGCGLPSVTLEGERSDYEELLKRIERLKDFAKDIETKNPGSEKVKQLRRWYDYLRPVLSRFAKAFDDPHGEENLDFWQRVADKEGGGSSVPYFSGWINAFCVFDTEGRWIGGKLDESDPGNTQVRHRQRTLILDSITYPVNSVIPYGYASVPVKVDDGEELECEMVSGLVGMKLTSQDSVQPFAGWCIFVKKPEDEVELDEYGRRY